MIIGMVRILVEGHDVIFTLFCCELWL